MKTILTTALLLGTIADSDNKSNKVQAVKLQAKADMVLEQAAEAMTGISSSISSSTAVDEQLALKAEVMTEEDALADLEVEEQLLEDEQKEETIKNEQIKTGADKQP